VLLPVILMVAGVWASESTQTSQTPKQAESKPANASNEIDNKLLRIRRIYVDSFGDDTQSKQLQAMVISSLAESKKFIITENKDKADAVFKGTGLEKTSQELHATSEGTSVGAAAAAVEGDSGSAIARRMATHDAQASTETINDARVAVRLVSADGDVIWATTKESKGAKYKGASADVAGQVVKQLLWDLEKAEKSQKSNESAKTSN
jgi:hypothetical protein